MNKTPKIKKQSYCLWLLMVLTIFSLLKTARAAELPTLNWIPRSDWLDVKAKYGAVGDGQHDDTANIQEALTAAPLGGTVYFPPGNYKLSTTLQLTGRQRFGIVLIGCGRATTLSWYGKATDSMLKIDGNPYGRYEGLVFDGRGIADTGCHHHNPTTFETSVRYKNVGFYNFPKGDGVYAEGPGAKSSAEVSFQNCIFDHCAYGIGIYGVNQYDYTFAGCDFISCGCGIWCQTGNFYARDCYFQGSTNFDIWAKLPEHGCSVRRCKSTGSAEFIHYTGSVPPLSVQDCYVTGWTSPTGAIYYEASATLSLSHTRFVNPPNEEMPPVNCTGAPPILDCDNMAPSSPQIYKIAKPEILYQIPKGKYRPAVGSANGDKIKTFIDGKVSTLSAIFDAKVDFGAKGDGVTDDTAAVQKTIDAARAKGNGAMAYLPLGKYKITSTLNVTGDNYIFGGGSYHTALVWRGPAGGAMVAVNGTSAVTLENMRVGHHDDGPQQNAVDIDVTGHNTGLTFRGIYVYGKYQKQPEIKGLHINAPDSDVLLDFVEGNLRIDSGDTEILGNVTYEGAITVDHGGKGAPKFQGFQTRLSTGNAYGVIARNSSNFLISDWYQEQNTGGLLASGTAGNPPGRITIQSPNTDLPPDAPFMTIDNYAGKILYGTNQMYANTKTQKIVQTGTAPLQIVLFGNLYYENELSVSLTSANVSTVGSWGGSPSAPQDNYARSAPADVSTAYDDFQHLGVTDLQRNFPSVFGLLDYPVTK